MEQTACGGKSTSGVWDFFSCSSRDHLLRCQKFWHLRHALVCFHFWPFPWSLQHGLCNSIRIHLDPCSLSSSKIWFKNSFCQSLNGDLEDTTFKCRRPRNEWLNCLACYCRNPWSRNARTRRHSKCYKTKLIARLVLRQKGKVLAPKKTSSANWNIGQ